MSGNGPKRTSTSLYGLSANRPKADLNPVKVKVEATNAFNQVTFIDQPRVRGSFGGAVDIGYGRVPARLRAKARRAPRAVKLTSPISQQVGETGLLRASFSKGLTRN